MRPRAALYRVLGKVVPSAQATGVSVFRNKKRTSLTPLPLPHPHHPPHFPNSLTRLMDDKNCSGIKSLPFLNAVEGRVVEGTAPFLWA